MRNRAMLALLLLPLSAMGEAVVELQPQHCVWHPGDDASWAAPVHEESDWRPLTEWKLKPGESKIWIRCHADLSRLEIASSVSAEVQLYGAYELYVNGEKVGGSGNLDSGNFSMNVVRAVPIATIFVAGAASDDCPAHHLQAVWSVAHRTPTSVAYCYGKP